MLHEKMQTILVLELEFLKVGFVGLFIARLHPLQYRGQLGRITPLKLNSFRWSNRGLVARWSYYSA